MEPIAAPEIEPIGLEQGLRKCQHQSKGQVRSSVVAEAATVPAHGANRSA